MTTQLTLLKRDQIATLLAAGQLQKDIAVAIDVSRATISRELARNGGCANYDPDKAHQRATKLRNNAQKPIKMLFQVIQWIETKIRLEWSPEQIANTIEATLGVSISHERIYQHIRQDKLQGGSLYKHLRQRGKTQEV